jgi:DNA-binding IscR family transcriptional regulator
VVRAMETAANPIEDPAGSELGRKVVRPLWVELDSEVMNRLDSITIEELCLRAHKARVDSEANRKLDFSI